MTYNGYVKWYDPKKHFGFIRYPIEQTEWFEVFFHQSELRSSVTSGDFVLFTIGRDKKGRLKAMNVKKKKITEALS